MAIVVQASVDAGQSHAALKQQIQHMLVRLSRAASGTLDARALNSDAMDDCAQLTLIDRAWCYAVPRPTRVQATSSRAWWRDCTRPK